MPISKGEKPRFWAAGRQLLFRPAASFEEDWTMTLKQVTLKEVREAAAKSKRAAIRCEIKNWQYLHSKSLAELGSRRESYMLNRFCALCQRYRGCYRKRRPCPLAKFKQRGDSCIPLWSKAHLAVLNKDEECWTKYSGEMVELLKGLL